MKEKKISGIGKKVKFHPLRFFENNTLLLIFAFLCAIIIWFSMMGTTTMRRETVISNVPVNIQISEDAQEAGIRIFSQSASSTDVSITGNSLVTSKITSEDVGVSGTLNPATSMLTGNSLQQTNITLRAYKKGNTLADYEVQGVTPSEVTVLYDKYKETQLTLETEIKYTAADNFYASATPTLSTDLITISGPESSVNKVARAALIYTFAEELTQSKAVSCKVTLYDVNGSVIDPTEQYLTLSDDTIDVSIQVSSRQTVQLQADIRNMPEGFSENRITIEPETFEIAGDAETISKYKTLMLATPINFADVTPDNCEFAIAIPVPNGVTNISKVETATVKINLNGYSKTQLLTNNISVTNMPEGKKAEITTKSLRVEIVGTAAQISKLTADSIFCTIDLSSVTDPTGSIEVPVTVSVLNADSCWATGTYTAHITLSDAAKTAENTSSE